MKNRQGERFRVACIFATSIGLLIVGIPNGQAAAKTMANCQVVMIPKTTDNPFYAAIHFGADQAAKELKGEKVQFAGTAQADSQGQIQRVQAAATNKTCILNPAAVDASAIVPSLKAAAKKGVKIVAFDADIADKSARTLFITQDSTDRLGKGMFIELATQMNNKGDWAILSAQSTAQNQNAWIEGMKKEAAKSKYAGMNLVKTVYGDDDDKKSYDEAIALLNAFPNLSGVMAPEPAGVGAFLKAKDDLKYNPDLVITGLGWLPGQGDALKSGKLKAFFLWSPVDLGYLTYYADAALISGKITGKKGDTFMAGRLGKMTVGADGEVNMRGMQRYTAENVDAGLEGYRTK